MIEFEEDREFSTAGFAQLKKLSEDRVRELALASWKNNESMKGYETYKAEKSFNNQYSITLVGSSKLSRVLNKAFDSNNPNLLRDDPKAFFDFDKSSSKFLTLHQIKHPELNRELMLFNVLDYVGYRTWYPCLGDHLLYLIFNKFNRNNMINFIDCLGLVSAWLVQANVPVFFNREIISLRHGRCLYCGKLHNSKSKHWRKYHTDSYEYYFCNDKERSYFYTKPGVYKQLIDLNFTYLSIKDGRRFDQAIFEKQLYSIADFLITKLIVICDQSQSQSKTKSRYEPVPDLLVHGLMQTLNERRFNDLIDENEGVINDFYNDEGIRSYTIEQLIPRLDTKIIAVASNHYLLVDDCIEYINYQLDDEYKPSLNLIRIVDPHTF